MKRLILVLIAAFGLNSCCTKVACVNLYTHLLTVRYEGFTNAELNSGYAITFDTANNRRIDSLPAYSGNFTLPPHYYAHTTVPLEQVGIYISIAGKSYIVKNLIPQITRQRIECNRCFPADGSETITDVTTKSFTYNGASMTDVDTLIIKP